MNDGRVFIIAEAGVNHNGALGRAFELVEAAAASGADAVKFQTFVPELLAVETAPKAEYQCHNEAGTESQLEMLRRLHLNMDDHHALVAHCEKHGIQFLSSPFDQISADFLIHGLNLPLIKLGSGEITNGPLLYRIAQSGKRLILSTGMSSLEEVYQALSVLALGYAGKPAGPECNMAGTSCESMNDLSILAGKVTLLHCTTEYPCPLEDVHLRAMNTLHDRFGLKVGYSDHTQGITIAIAAVARGAAVIEKHFTLDRNLPGPDHRASLEPEEMICMVRAIRETEAALGSEDKRPTQGELKNARVARKSLVAACKIVKGERYSEDNLACKRPANGRSPMDYWGLIGQAANRDYELDELIDP